MTELTQVRLHELLDYDPETGVLTWKVDRKGHTRAGNIAGSLTRKDGYLSLTVDGRRYLAHRLVWMHVHGVMPNIIDHANGIRTDNRISNLRNTTRAGNNQNIRTPKGISQFVGVYWLAREQRWVSGITVNGISRRLGYFKTEAEAHAAYLKAKAELHGYWASEIAA